MNQIARCDWLPERARWSHLARSGLPLYPDLTSMKNFPESQIVHPLLTKFVRSRWLDIGLVLFFFFASLWTSTSSRSINTQKKEKDLTNIQPSWPHTWSITHTYVWIFENGVEFGAKVFRLPAGDSLQGGLYAAWKARGGFRQGVLGQKAQGPGYKLVPGRTPRLYPLGGWGGSQGEAFLSVKVLIALARHALRA